MNCYIGIDMAWRIDGNHSGIAVMHGDQRRVRLIATSSGISTMVGVIDFVSSHWSADTVIAIDASLVVKNETGQRPCETLIGKAFGRYHASCHTSNLGRPHATTGMRLVGAFERLGVRHDFDITRAKQRGGRWILEVYPHPAMVRLFGLQRIIQYKKGSVAERRTGLGILRQHLRHLVGEREGWVNSPILSELLDRDLQPLRGGSLKRYEDTLDAVFCAYLAWHCWRFGAEQNEVFGTLERGYIVVPRHGMSKDAVVSDDHAKMLSTSDGLIAMTRAAGKKSGK